MTSDEAAAAKAAEAERHQEAGASAVRNLFRAPVVSHRILNHSPWGGTVDVIGYVNMQDGRVAYVIAKVMEDRNGATFEARNLDLFGRLARDGVNSPKLLSPIAAAANDGVIIEEFIAGENLQHKLDRNPDQRLPLYTFQSLLGQLVVIHSSYHRGGLFQNAGIRDGKFSGDLQRDVAGWTEAVRRDVRNRQCEDAVIAAAESIDVESMVRLLTTSPINVVRGWGDGKPSNAVDRPDSPGSVMTTPVIVDLQESSIASPYWDLAQTFEMLPVQAQARFFSDYLRMMRNERDVLTNLTDEEAWQAMAQAHMYNVIQGRGFALAFEGIDLMDWKADKSDGLLVRAASVANHPDRFRIAGQGSRGYILGQANGESMMPLTTWGGGKDHG